MIHCSFCGEPIPSTRHAYRKVTGWEQERKAGGTNALRLREPQDVWACAHCIGSLSGGRDPGQGSLL